MTLVPMTLLYILVFYAVGVNMLNDQATINDKAQGEECRSTHRGRPQQHGVHTKHKVQGTIHIGTTPGNISLT